MPPEKLRATMAIVNRLNKLAKKCDEVGVTLGNGGEIGSVLGAIADDLESQVTKIQMGDARARKTGA